MVFQVTKPTWFRTPKLVSQVQAVRKADTSEKLSLLAGFVGRQAEWLRKNQAENSLSSTNEADIQIARVVNDVAGEREDVEGSTSAEDPASPSDTEADADDSASSSETLNSDQEPSDIREQSLVIVTADVAPKFVSEQHWDAIMQLSFRHFREQEALKALLFSAELAHRNELEDLRIKEEERIALLQDEAEIVCERACERAANRNTMSTNIRHRREVNALRREHRRELSAVRRDGDEAMTELTQELSTARHEIQRKDAILQNFQESQRHLNEIIGEQSNQVNQYQVALAESRLEMERKAGRIRVLERSEHQLNEAVTTMRNEQAFAEEQLQQLSIANTVHANFLGLVGERPADADSPAQDSHARSQDCASCSTKDEQNRILQGASRSMAEKIVENQHIMEVAHEQMALLRQMAADLHREDRTQPQELITLQRQQLNDLRQENSDLTKRANDEIRKLKMEMMVVKGRISRWKQKCEAKDAELALAAHGAAETDKLRSSLAVVLDMATKKQNERQVRRSAAVLNRERHSFSDELAQLTAHYGAYKELMSKACDEMVKAKVDLAEEQKGAAKLREANDELEKKWTTLNVEYQEVSWKTEHHDTAMKELSNQRTAEVQQRDQAIANLQSRLNEFISYRPPTADHLALALLDMERNTSQNLQRQNNDQRSEIERLTNQVQRFKTYASSYELLNAHVVRLRNGQSAEMDETRQFDRALFEEIGEEFGEEAKNDLRRKAFERFQESKREGDSEREERSRAVERVEEEFMQRAQDEGGSTGRRQAVAVWAAGPVGGL